MTSKKFWSDELISKTIKENNCLLYFINRTGKRIKIDFSDSEKYKYSMDLYDMIKGRRLPFGKSNPFTLYNISIWLKNNKKNFEINDENYYLGSNVKLKFFCNDCNNIFLSSWDNVLCGHGCGVCSGNQVTQKNSLFYLRPNLMEEWSIKNTIDPKEIPLYSSKEAIWICKYGHEWSRKISARTANNYGCPYCSGKFSTKENNFSKKFPFLLPEWDYLKNGNPEDYTPYSNKKVWWKCSKCGNEWVSKILKRSNGNNCPKCCSSEGEKRISMILSNLNLDFISEYRFEDCRNILPLPFDFYIPKKNMCIEYQGEHHYNSLSNRGGDRKLEYVKKNDLIKKNYCRDKEIFLLEIPYWEFQKIEKILENIFVYKEGKK